MLFIQIITLICDKSKKMFTKQIINHFHKKSSDVEAIF